MHKCERLALAEAGRAVTDKVGAFVVYVRQRRGGVGKLILDPMPKIQDLSARITYLLSVCKKSTK